MLKGKLYVTVARNGVENNINILAKCYAQQLNALYIERQEYKSVDSLLEQSDVAAVIVFEKNGPRIHSKYGNFAYHPGMSVLRMQQIKNGKQDYLAEALDLKLGSKVLDCTLGLAADAVIASYYVGDTGKIIGLEASSLIYCVVEYGLKKYNTNDSDLNDAMRNIKTICVDANTYLKKCMPNSFDVIYFDPMFRNPVQGAKAMDALRPLSYSQPLGRSTVKLALKIAPRVVIKERNEYILQGYGCKKFVGGKYSKFKYGIITRADIQ